MSVFPDTDTVYVARGDHGTITLAIAQPDNGRNVFAKISLSLAEAEDVIDQLRNCMEITNLLEAGYYREARNA